MLALVALASAGAPPWHGSINEAFESAPNPRVAAPFDMAWLAGRLHATVDPDLGALPDTLSLLYGSAATHPALARVLAWHHIGLDADGVTVGATRVTLAEPFLIAALPHPDHPERPVLVYTAWDPAAQPLLNRVFHGPTPIVLGTAHGEALSSAFAGDWQGAADGPLERLRVGAAVLTRDEALEDLHTLTAQLDRGWAGLEDLDEQLDGGWSARVAATEARIATQERLTWEESWALFSELLAPVRDAHFSLSGQAITADGRPVSELRRFTTPWRPRFADGRLTGGEGTWTFDGAPLAEVPPPVPGPDAVALGVPYRFPTVLQDGTPAWLLGEFTTNGQELPPLVLEGRPLPLHAPRSTRSGRAEPWALAGEVLTVTTMNEARLDGLAETADTLRELPRIVLDLRGNGGGSDTPAQQWVTRLHPGFYRWTPGADLRPGDSPRAERLRSWDEARLGRKPTRRTAWAGELRVLIDGGVASSGETFTQLAVQVPGARLYGVPTAGCSRYGNLVTQPPLPHTGLVATFGHTFFDWASIRPVVEGVGIFPDVWLDEADPVAFVRGLPQ